MKSAQKDSLPTYYVSTPIYYVNARPHLGHAYSTLLADVLVRLHRQLGERSFFLTGTDEHGEKIEQMALKAGKSPKDFASENSAYFEKAWNELGIAYDRFYRTTEPKHYEMVQAALSYLHKKGDIYFGSYKGKYCVGCERFRTDQEWDEAGLCPDHKTSPELREEKNYFFKMSAYQERLLEHYRRDPKCIEPSFYLKEVLSMLSEPLDDLSISRPVERLSWGIPLPFDKDYVTYVWFDALLNYLGGIGYGGSPEADSQFDHQLWASVHHLVGKDILKTHAVYWPTMLMALELPIFKRLEVSGFWMMSGSKMSKSLGNVVDPLEIHEQFGVEKLRYFLLREASYGSDASFRLEAFAQRCNADLANGLGNLASRVLTLAHKNCEAKVPTDQQRSPKDQELLTQLHALPTAFKQSFEECRYHKGLEQFSASVALCDRYINDEKPWALAKDPAQKKRLEAVLGTAMDALWTLAVVIHSVMPESSIKLAHALGQGKSVIANEGLPWAEALKGLPEGQSLGEVPRLFPRLEIPESPAEN